MVVREEDFRTFREDWAPEDSLDILESAKIMGSYFTMGDIIVMKDMDARAKSIWKNYLEGFFDKDHQIDEKTAITIIRYSLIISTLTHEIVHSVQIPEGFKEFEEKSKEKKITDKDIKNVIRFKALAECGASYITNKILKERYTDIMPIEIDPATEEVRYDPAEKRIKFFDHILDKYGENAYYVFFNTKPNNMDSESFNNLKEDVFREFNSQVLADIEIIKEDEKEAFDQLAD